MIAKSKKTRKATNRAPDVDFVRTVSVSVAGVCPAVVEIEEAEGGRKLITLAGHQIDDAFTGILKNQLSVGWSFSELEECEEFARSMLAAVAKARAVGIGAAKAERARLTVA